METHGLRLGLRIDDRSLIPEIDPHLPPDLSQTVTPGSEDRSEDDREVDLLLSVIADGPGPRPGVRRLGQIYSGSRLVGRYRRRDDLLEGLEREIDQLVSEHARDRIFVHAGAVGWQGRALLLPGTSHSGKTTLTLELVRRGCAFLSDDYAVLDASGRVYPYPRRPRVRGGDRSRRLELDELPGPIARESMPAGWVVLSPYVSGATLDPQPLGSGATALALLAHTVPARRDPDRALGAVLAAAKTAVGLQGDRGEAEAAASVLLRAMSHPRVRRSP